MPKRKRSKRSKRIPKKSSFHTFDLLSMTLSLSKGHVFVLVVGIILVVLVGFSRSSALQNVLGEQVLTPCSSGILTTSTNKVYQMVYPNETFLQLVNIDLLKDVAQLKDLTCLQYLDATDRVIKGDIADLKNLTNLEVFSLFSNPEVSGDICSLSGATNLRNLKLAFDPKITGNVSCLKNLTKLETFAMTYTQLSGDISVFANMPNLKSLYINGTKIKGDICSLSKLTNMEELGIADEVGNPDITGDLACLDNLQKLKRVSIYNTGTTNCEQFTKSHSNIAQMGKTESGRQSGGGCSKESQKTLINVAQEYEKKIGKEEKDKESDSYNKDAFSDFGKGGSSDGGSKDNGNDQKYEEPKKGGNFFTQFVDLLKGFFSRLPIIGNIVGGKPGLQAGPDLTQGGPGGCKSQSECESFCSKTENREECSKFAPPGGSQGKDGESRPASTQRGEQAGPGGCKSESACQAFCSKPENREECSKFAPPGEEK